MELSETSIKEARKILNWVLENKYSDFYRKKYKGKIILSKIKTVEDFRKIPFLTREEIGKTEPLKRLFIPFEEVEGASLTSGTSGSGPLVSFYMEPSFRPDKKNISLNGLTVWIPLGRMGIKNVFILRPHFANSIMSLVFKKVNFNPIFGDIDNLSMSAQIAAKAEIEALHLGPTALYFFTPYLKKYYDLKKIKYINLSGEACSETKLKIFKATYPNAYITSTYGGSEDGLRGWKCDYIVENKSPSYHMSSLSIFECVDPITGESVDKGENGELIYTGLRRIFFVPIRYKTGDMGVIKKDKCKCGNKEPLFEVFGRVGIDSVSLHGTTFLADDVSNAIEKVGGLEDDFKAHIYERVSGGRINYLVVFQLVPKNKKMVDSKSYAQKVRDKLEKNLLVAASLTYFDLVQKDVFLPLRIELVRELPTEAKRKHFIMHN